jgi:hypothetical protein
MPFAPGVSGNPNGRVPGSKNKKSQIAFDQLLEIYSDNIPRLRVELEKLEGKEFVSEMRGLSEFVIPKLQRITSTTFSLEQDPEVSKEYFSIGGKTFEL